MEAQEGGLGADLEGHDRGHVPPQAAQGGHVHEQVGASSSSLSVAKRKAPMTKRQKPPAAKRLSSPVVTMVRSPGIRLVMSPRLLSPSASRARSPSMPRARSPSTLSPALEETRSGLGHTLQYRRAFEALAREDTQYIHVPSIEEWTMAEKLCNMLKIFYDTTLVVSGSKYPTTSCYFHEIFEVKKMLERESLNPDIVIACMVNEMKQKFQKYWDLSFLKICVPVVLDPRFKLGFLEYRLSCGFGDRAYGYFSKVKRAIRKLFDEYSLQIGDSTIGNAQDGSNVETIVDESNPWADWGQHLNAQQRNRVSELDKYLEEETVPITIDFDILQYWMMFSTKYPALARMAHDLLAAPASTVASESPFSPGESVISDYRSRLTSETVEALICFQDWIRADDTCTLLSTKNSRLCYAKYFFSVIAY